MNQPGFSRQLPPELVAEVQRRKSLLSRFALLRAQLLESRVLADRIPDRVEAELCWSNIGRGRLKQTRQIAKRRIGLAKLRVNLRYEHLLRWFGQRVIRSEGHRALSLTQGRFSVA